MIVAAIAAPAKADVASWYGPGFHGKTTASGQKFNQWAMTAAHKTYKFGTKLLVTHKGKSVVVTVNDRGPFVKGRTIDLSKGAARKIGCHGVCRVNIKKLN
jgi:rare lipoprotein A